jgi:peptide/nickel transport system substrate-binding protein
VRMRRIVPAEPIELGKCGRDGGAPCTFTEIARIGLLGDLLGDRYIHNWFNAVPSPVARRSAAAFRDNCSSNLQFARAVTASRIDVPELRAGCEVTNEMFTRIGLNVDYAALDSGTVETRRLSREPVEKAGWSAHCIIFEGLGAVDPSSHGPLRGNGLAAFPGWPTSPELETLRDHWFAAPDVASQRGICRDMQRVAWEQIPAMPLSQVFFPTAVRSDIKDVLTAPFPIFLNVRRG